MDMINGSSQLQDKWEKLSIKLIKSVKDEFYETLGVPVPTALQAEVSHIAKRLEFATNADLGDLKKGASDLIGDVFKEDWPKVALDAVDFVGNLIEKILGSGELSDGVEGDSQKITVADKDNPGKEKIFIVAAFSSNEACKASDWGGKETFYASAFVYALWSPADDELKLMKL